MLKGRIIKIVETPDIHWVKYICRGEDNTNFECREKDYYRMEKAGGNVIGQAVYFEGNKLIGV